MKSIHSVIATGVLTATISFSGAAMAQETHDHADHAKMGEMHGMKMSMTGDADYDFVKNMRQHHEMGVKMAKDEVKNGKDADAKMKAQKIIDAQTKEIAELDAWLASHKAPMATPKK